MAMMDASEDSVSSTSPVTVTRQPGRPRSGQRTPLMLTKVEREEKQQEKEGGER